MRIQPKPSYSTTVTCWPGPSRPPDVEALAAILDLPISTFTEMYWRFRVSYDAAEFDAATYWRTVAYASTREVVSEQIDRLVEIDGLSWCHPAPVMPQWARDIRREGLRTALLSNMPATVRQAVERAGWLPEFDVQTFSCEVGICKPAPEIYRRCLNDLGCEASEVLFLDDRPERPRRGGRGHARAAIHFARAGSRSPGSAIQFTRAASIRGESRPNTASGWCPLTHSEAPLGAAPNNLAISCCTAVENRAS